MKVAARRLSFALVAGVAACACLAATGSPKDAKPSAVKTTLDSKQRELHALDRLTFGPRQQDVADIERLGVDKWIEQQLHPEKIDDSAMRARLADLPAMRLNEQQLIQKFPPPPMLRAMERSGARLPSDPVEHAIYENQAAYLKAQAKQVAKYTANGNAMANMEEKADAAANAAAAAQNQQELDPQEIASIRADKQRLLALPTEQRFQALLQLTPGEPRKLLQRLSQPERLQMVEGFTPEQKEITLALADCNRVVAGEAMQEKLLYDVYSQRQLLEVMTDFWLNHFNVYLRKSGIAPWQIATYEREVLRPNALGKFEDLLRAVATSPAMMTYLDNAESIGPDSKAAQFQAQRAAQNAAAKGNKRGLNENYARELMELHTLGVNGGYTQHDVTEVAKVFTGWTVEAPRDGGNFVYLDRRHEPGDKTVLGKTIRENGQQEGFEVLHMLATSPATAHFIARKLAVRFVSDNPPQSLIDAMARTYLSTGGDIRQVLRSMFTSPEFWSRDAYRAKVKTPLEYVVSAVRASGSDASHPQSLISALNQMGMPLYGQQPPTGYPDVAESWVSSSALLTRMNFGLALAANKLPGLEFDSSGLVSPGEPPRQELQLEQVLLNGVVAEKTHAAVLAEMQKLPQQEAAAQQFASNVADPMEQGMVPRKRAQGARQVDLNISTAGVDQANIAAGLLLGSPDFQRK